MLSSETTFGHFGAGLCIDDGEDSSAGDLEDFSGPNNCASLTGVPFFVIPNRMRRGDVAFHVCIGSDAEKVGAFGSRIDEDHIAQLHGSHCRIEAAVGNVPEFFACGWIVAKGGTGAD